MYEQLQQEHNHPIPAAAVSSDGNEVSHLGAFFSGDHRSSNKNFLPPVVKMSPYMFYHGDPKEVSLVFNEPAEDGDSNLVVDASTSKKGRRQSKAGGGGGGGGCAEEENPNSAFRNSDLREALFASNQHFTHGRSSSTLSDVQQRYRFQSRLRNAGGVDGNSSLQSDGSDISGMLKHANLARIQRLIMSKLIREAGAALLKMSRNIGTSAAIPAEKTSGLDGTISGTTSGSSSSVRAKVRGANAKVVGDDAVSPTNAANSSLDTTSISTTVDLGRGSAIYAKAASELRIGLLLDIFRDEFGITCRPLLDGLREGLVRLNKRLGQGLPVSTVVLSSSSYAASAAGCIAVGAVMELLDLYVNGQPSVDTRHACFDIFDVSKQRVVTLKHLRSLRGLSDAKLKKQTNEAGSFPMLKALMDTFQSQEELSTTLTQEQVVSLFDLDDGVMVEGFLEEILRQIAQHEFGMTRDDLL
jgi:hypothetical protein